MSLLSRAFYFAPALLIACGGGEPIKDDTAGGDDTAPDVESITPSEGSYAISNPSFTEDNCNAQMNLTIPTEFNFTSVGDGQISYELYEGPFLLGTAQCTEGDANTYTCDTLNTSFDAMPGTTITIDADAVFTINTTDSFAGNAVLTLTCAGADCATVASNTPKGFPCSSIWHYEANLSE